MAIAWGRLGRRNLSRARVGVVALTVALAGCAAPKGGSAGPATGAAADPGGNPAGTGGWASRTVRGLPAGSHLWDVAVSATGLLVAVGTVGTGDDDGGLPLVIWRSADGFTWEESFRRIEELVDPEDASGLPSPSAVVAHPVGFTVVASTCPDGCRPFALYSADGIEWQEAAIPVRPPGGQDTSAAPARGGGATSVVGGKRLIRGTPSRTLEGAEVLDVVAAGSRLVAVGWTQGDGYATAHAVWHSDDGGRTWRQLPEAAIPQDAADQNELDKVVFAGDRLVAGGGNRCCHGQAVGEVWVADATGERWRPVPFPDGALVTIDELVVTTDAVDIVGGTGDFGEDPALWRLSPQDRWERLPAPPLPGRLLAHPGGLMLVGSETTGTSQLRLTLFRSPDGRQFRLSKASAPRQALEVELTLTAGERLLAYVTAGEGDDVQRLLFTAGAHERADPGGRAVWAARLRPSPVLFGEGVRVPGDKARFVDVTPREKSPAELVVDAFFVDSDHGWALLADSEDKGHRILFTTDGGRRWAASLLDTGADTPRWLFFVDREHGWMAAHPAMPGSPPTSSLYRTADGGRTWSGPTTIPGCGPVHFDTVLHGWLADPGFRGGCGDGLYETLDGGGTWTERQVVRQPQGTGVDRLDVRHALPRLTSRVLPVGLIEGERSRVTFFVSGDRGETWSFAGSIELPGRERYPHASVADADAWWAADSEGTVVAVTTDGGGRWRKVRPAGIQGRWVSLEAIDERRAWAIEANAAGVRVMQTDDGGARWRPLLEG